MNRDSDGTDFEVGLLLQDRSLSHSHNHFCMVDLYFLSLHSIFLDT